MTPEADELDEQLRERLTRAADRDPASAPRLDARAQSRVLAALVQESARLARRRRQRGWAAGALVAVAASVGLVWSVRPLREPLPTSQAVVAVDAACGLPTASTGLHIAVAADRQRILLGRFGQLAAEHDATLRIVSSTPCELTVALTRGMLAAELHDLRPARLRVLTSLGDVEVRGTTFSVRVGSTLAHDQTARKDEADGALEVVLLHGAVDVVSGQQVARMTPGQTLRREKRAATTHIEPSTQSAAQAIETLIADAPTTHPVRAPEPESLPLVALSAPDAAVSDIASRRSATRGATELLASAERERRAGQLEAARALYREAGSRRGTDAEVALLRWARLELSAHAPAAARDVLARYRQHFANGRLAAEAGWLELRALEELGDVAAARTSAQKLVQRYPDSPHAEAAKRLLSTP